MLLGSQCDSAAWRAIVDQARDLEIDLLDAAEVYPVPASPTPDGLPAGSPALG